MQNMTTPNHSHLNPCLQLSLSPSAVVASSPLCPVISAQAGTQSPPDPDPSLMPTPCFPLRHLWFKSSASSESSVTIRIRHSDFVIDSEFWFRNSSFAQLPHLAYLDFSALSKHAQNMSKHVQKWSTSCQKWPKTCQNTTTFWQKYSEIVRNRRKSLPKSPNFFWFFPHNLPERKRPWLRLTI